MSISVPPEIFTSATEVASLGQLERAPVANTVTIRGVRLPLDELVNYKLFEPEQRQRFRDELLAATPEGLHRVENWDQLPAVGTEL